YSDGELAFTSFDRILKEFNKRSDQGNRFHPTQKPIQLYKWCLTNYAKKGDKIFDSHGGSFSSAIAALDMGFSFNGTEIDEEYFNNAVKRIKNNNQEYLL
ncbi:MAG: DNA methyltransferase, partial [Candidatus Theseobacter exili]|nr:DNA methyltransferase [Candidatus Theseobacter exili]